jgi:hypothetical protein
VAGEVILVGEGDDFISFFVRSFNFNHDCTINYFL